LIDRTGTPMVCDFGLSYAPLENGDHGGNTTTSAYHGTVRYVPRELIDGVSKFYTPHPTKESDVHAIGCIGFEVRILVRLWLYVDLTRR
jgi:serine/threonine protein kinase